jgi:glycine/D-amino acid oxidase-like deaminating enzyme
MELTSDYPYWSIRNGLPNCYPALDHDLHCDVVVVGGGITGALAAFYLVEANVDVVLLDRREIGTGSTSGSTGLLQYEVDVPLRELVRRLGPARAARSYCLCHEAVRKLGALAGRLKIDCDFEFRSSLFLARRAAEIPGLREEARMRRDLGIEVEFWNQSRIEKHYPFSRPAGLFSAIAAQVDPHHLTHGLLAAGRRRGLRVFDRTAAAALQPARRGITITSDRGFILRARRVVVAAGFESLRYLRGEAGRLKSTFALISEPLPAGRIWHRQSLIWESGQPYLYLRTTRDHRVIVGGEDVDVVNPTRRDLLIGRKERILKRKFQALFPQLPFETAYAWAGTFAETKDGLAYIGAHPCLRHAYFALGFGGNGITYSLIAAELIRDAFLGRKNLDASLFRFGR